MIWMDLAVLLVGGFVTGWYAHLWCCCRRKGCPLWRVKKTRDWTRSWSTRYPDGKHDRPPSTEVRISDNDTPSKEP